MTQTTPSANPEATPAADASTTPTEPPWANDTVEFANTASAPATRSLSSCEEWGGGSAEM